MKEKTGATYSELLKLSKTAMFCFATRKGEPMTRKTPNLPNQNEKIQTDTIPIAEKLAAISFPIHFIGVHLAHLRLWDFRNYARLEKIGSLIYCEVTITTSPARDFGVTFRFVIFPFSTWPSTVV